MPREPGPIILHPPHASPEQKPLLRLPRRNRDPDKPPPKLQHVDKWVNKPVNNPSFIKGEIKLICSGELGGQSWPFLRLFGMDHRLVKRNTYVTKLILSAMLFSCFLSCFIDITWRSISRKGGGLHFLGARNTSDCFASKMKLRCFGLAFASLSTRNCRLGLPLSSRPCFSQALKPYFFRVLWL